MMTDIDARRRLPHIALQTLDAIVELTQGSTEAIVTRDGLDQYFSQPRDDVDEALSVLTDRVRRLRASKIGNRGAPEEFSLIYVPLGDAYAAYLALYEPRDLRPDGCAPRAAMEAWQGRWPELGHIDFDAGLQSL